MYNRTVTINLNSATSGLRDIATLAPYIGIGETQAMLRALATRYEQMADEQDAEAQPITEMIQQESGSVRDSQS